MAATRSKSRRWLISSWMVLVPLACGGESVTAPSVQDPSDVTLQAALGSSPGSMALVPPALPAASPARQALVYGVTPNFPVAGSALTDPIPRSSWLTVRSASRIVSRLRIAGLTPGHVYNIHFVIFNHPEFCTHGSAKYSPPAACGAFGPMDPRDGAIPEVQFSVVNFRGVLAGPSGMAVFVHKLGEDTPDEVLTGPYLTNPSGAQIFANVVDKGPELPAGPARDLQYETLRGGCVGPPFFGPYPCTFAGNALLR